MAPSMRLDSINPTETLYESRYVSIDTDPVGVRSADPRSESRTRRQEASDGALGEHMGQRPTIGTSGQSLGAAAGS